MVCGVIATDVLSAGIVMTDIIAMNALAPLVVRGVRRSGLRAARVVPCVLRGPAAVLGRGLGVRVEAVGLGLLGLDPFALLVDLGALPLGLGLTALGRELLLLGLLGLALGVQAGTISVELRLARLQVALLDRLLLLLGLLADLGRSSAVLLLLAGLLALRSRHAQGDQNDQDDQDGDDDPDDDGGGQFHGRLLAVDSSARCARRSSCLSS